MNVVDVIQDLYDEYGEDVCVLNFASGWNPSGGWLKGRVGQEEVLAYCSDLFRQQTSPEGMKMYNANKAFNSNAYLNNMLLSDVAFFRESDYSLVEEPAIVSVVTAPAVNVSRAKKMKEVLAEDSLVTMKKRMELILKVMVESGRMNIVLGAFGCGAYGNDAVNILLIWEELLIGKEYACYFDTITFSIPKMHDGDNTYNLYEKIFVHKEKIVKPVPLVVALDKQEDVVKESSDATQGDIKKLLKLKNDIEKVIKDPNSGLNLF